MSREPRPRLRDPEPRFVKNPLMDTERERLKKIILEKHFLEYFSQTGLEQNPSQNPSARHDIISLLTHGGSQAVFTVDTPEKKQRNYVLKVDIGMASLCLGRWIHQVKNAHKSPEEASAMVEQMATTEMERLKKAWKEVAQGCPHAIIPTYRFFIRHVPLTEEIIAACHSNVLYTKNLMIEEPFSDAQLAALSSFPVICMQQRQVHPSMRALSVETGGFYMEEDKDSTPFGLIDPQTIHPFIKLQQILYPSNTSRSSAIEQLIQRLPDTQETYEERPFLPEPQLTEFIDLAGSIYPGIKAIFLFIKQLSPKEQKECRAAFAELDQFLSSTDLSLDVSGGNNLQLVKDSHGVYRLLFLDPFWGQAFITNNNHDPELAIPDKNKLNIFLNYITSRNRGLPASSKQRMDIANGRRAFLTFFFFQLLAYALNIKTACTAHEANKVHPRDLIF